MAKTLVELNRNYRAGVPGLRQFNVLENLDALFCAPLVKQKHPIGNPGLQISGSGSLLVTFLCVHCPAHRLECLCDAKEDQRPVTCAES